jgi:hypothetical protein
MLKKGDTVVMHTCGEAEHYDGKIWICRTDEQKLHEKHNYTVVWLEGFSGCFATEYLQKVDVSPYVEEMSRLYNARYSEISDIAKETFGLDE